jgi:hypothetical protein
MRKFPTPDAITAVLNVPAGRVRFIAADRDDTTVDVRPADPAKNRDTKAAEQTTVAYDDGVLHVTAATGRLAGSVEVTVQLPAGSHVKVTAAATELRAAGRLGDVTFDGAYGHIELDEAATLHLTATDGDVEIGRLGGPAHVTTQRGDIRVAEATRGTLTLNTRSGDITVGAGVSATLDAATPRGRVTNTLKNDGTPALDVHATTTDGDITARGL